MKSPWGVPLPRAGLGPAPTIKMQPPPPVRRRGGYQPPASLPPLRGKVPSTCEADDGGLRYGRDPTAGRPVSGPYAKNAPASLFAVGAAPCGRPHLIRHGLWPCHLPLKGKARVRITPPTQSPTEWVCVGEEEQWSGRSFRRQAETETSGLCDDDWARRMARTSVLSPGQNLGGRAALPP